METKISGARLKQWLCKLLGCEVPIQSSPPVYRNGNLETFQYDGYDMEVRLFPDQRSLRIRVHLKGNCVAVGDYPHPGGVIHWHEDGLHYPSYKTRKYMQEYAKKRLTQMKDSK